MLLPAPCPSLTMGVLPGSISPAIPHVSYYSAPTHSPFPSRCLHAVCPVSQFEDGGAAETRVVQLVGLDHFELAKELLKNRLKIVWVIKLRQAETEEQVCDCQLCMWFACGGVHVYVQHRGIGCGQ